MFILIIELIVILFVDRGILIKFVKKSDSVVVVRMIIINFIDSNFLGMIFELIVFIILLFLIMVLSIIFIV